MQVKEMQDKELQVSPWLPHCRLAIQLRSKTPTARQSFTLELTLMGCKYAPTVEKYRNAGQRNAGQRIAGLLLGYRIAGWLHSYVQKYLLQDKSLTFGYCSLGATLERAQRPAMHDGIVPNRPGTTL